MAKRKATSRVSSHGAKILRDIAVAKQSATGRVWDELHYAESRLTRVYQGRKSTFTSARRKAKLTKVK